jgi:hypothetical protein
MNIVVNMKKLLVVSLLLLSHIQLLHAKIVILSDSKIQGRLNILNGASAECVMHHFYTDSGWIRIEGEVGRNGIDGLYYKKRNGIIREVLVAESKWNKAVLGRSGKNKLIRQMSKQWVLHTLERLSKYKPLPEYQSIKKLVMHDQYRARLFRLFPRGTEKVQIQVFHIKNKGFNDYDIKLQQTLPAISLNMPKNRFEHKVVKHYNLCRNKYLQKYFPMLDQKDREILLQDNYLQKKDIKDLLSKKE